MAEESFIIIEYPGSMEGQPYSYLDMPSEISSGQLPSRTSLSTVINQSPAQSNIGEATNKMISIWSKPENDTTIDSVANASQSNESTALTIPTAVKDVDDTLCKQLIETASIVQTNNDNAQQVTTNKDETNTVNQSTATQYINVHNSSNSSRERHISDDFSSCSAPLSTTPKDKLAESFLLGNIDYDTMMVSQSTFDYDFCVL